MGHRWPEQVSEGGRALRRVIGPGKSLGPPTDARRTLAHRQRDQLSVVAGAHGYGELPRRPLRQVGEDRTENGLRAGENVLRWRLVVYPRPGLRTHCGHAAQAQLSW